MDVGRGDAGIRVATIVPDTAVREGNTGTRVDVGVAGRCVGVTAAISAVGEGEGVGVLEGTSVAVGNNASVGVESGEATVAVARGDTERVDVAG
jgi:hypothetical protein